MKLNYKTFGQGPALVILHGLFGSLDNWQTLGRRIAEKRTVYLVDQRNHGKSKHVDGMDYSAMAEDLLGFFDANGIRQASVLGHSMGGKTAMRFALDHPALVESLLVADMGIKAYPAGHDQIFEALESLEPAKLENRSDAESTLSARLNDQGVVLFLLKNLTRRPEGGYRWKMNLPAIKKDYAKILAGIQADHDFDGPTLFVRGGASNYVADEDWPDIQALFPAAVLETLPGAGHWLHAEQPDAFYEVVENFLDRSV